MNITVVETQKEFCKISYASYVMALSGIQSNASPATPSTANHASKTKQTNGVSTGSALKSAKAKILLKTSAALKTTFYKLCPSNAKTKTVQKK